MSNFLFVDHITSLDPGSQTRGVKYITENDVYCQMHKGSRIFWPALIGETLGQLCAWNVMQTHDFKLRPVAGVAKSARVLGVARVGEQLDLSAEIHSLDTDAVLYSAVASVKGEAVFVLENALGPLLPMTQFIDETVVRAQYASLFHAPVNHASQKNVKLIEERYDSIIAHEKGVCLIAEKTVNGNAPYFCDHFPLKPVLPLTVLLHCHEQLAETFLNSALENFDPTKLELLCFKKIKMSQFVQPGSQIQTRVTSVSLTATNAELEFATTHNGDRVCFARAEFRF